MALALDIRHNRKIERVPGGIFERADSPLTEDYLSVAFREHVLGRHEEVFHGRAHAPLEQDWDLGPATFFEQIEVLHVPRADLEDIGIALDILDLARVHHFSHDRHAETIAGGPQDLEPVAPQTLEAVRACAGLERSAAQNIGAGIANSRSDLEQ